jgi:integrase
MATKRTKPKSWGTIQLLPSGAYRAFYRVAGERVTAPRTFRSKTEAAAWLASEQTDRNRGVWNNPKLGLVTLHDYATEWLATRTELSPRTRELYERSLAKHIVTNIGGAGRGVSLGDKTLSSLSPGLIRSWYATLSEQLRDSAAHRHLRTSQRRKHPARVWALENGLRVSNTGAISPEVLRAWTKAGQATTEPEQRAIPATAGKAQTVQAYQLLHAILETAVRDGLIPKNPCQIVNARAYRPRERTVATPAEVQQLSKLMPPQFAAAVILASWSGLRFGEMFALARRHVNLDEHTVTVERSLLFLADQPVGFGSPKTAKSNRTVALPAFVVEALAEHLETRVSPSPEALLFAWHDGSPLTYARISGMFRRARAVIGRDELTWHDLRHTGASLAYSVGSSVVDVQARLGHATMRAASIYAHASGERDRMLAKRLNDAYAIEADGVPRLRAV